MGIPTRFLVLVAVTASTVACGATRGVAEPSGVDSGSASGPIAGPRGPIPPTQPLPPASATCDATKAQFAVGERASADLLNRARAAAGAAVARFVRPNEPITLELSAERLNLNLNAQDIVRSVNCG